jgi:hypothetical protein
MENKKQYNVKIVKVNKYYRDYFGDRYTRYFLEINGEECSYLISKNGDKPNRFFVVPNIIVDKMLSLTLKQYTNKINELSRYIEEVIQFN